MGRRSCQGDEQRQERQRHKGPDDSCHMEVATDEVREATQSHASESPVPDEGRSPNCPARRRRIRTAIGCHCGLSSVARRARARAGHNRAVALQPADRTKSLLGRHSLTEFIKVSDVEKRRKLLSPFPFSSRYTRCKCLGTAIRLPRWPWCRIGVMTVSPSAKRSLTVGTRACAAVPRHYWV
jgi:hypothetical protein